MDGRVEVFPNQSVMLHIPWDLLKVCALPPSIHSQCLLDKVLLSDNSSTQVANPIHRHNPNVLDGPEEILGVKSKLL